MRDTLVRLEEALLAEEAPADSHIWRARLSDMLLDGLRDPSGAMATLGADWRVALRDASCRIALRGYSHVFAHGAPGVGDHVTDERIGVRPTKTGFQERYSPETLRRILRCYAERQSPNQVRRDAIGDWQADLTATASAAPPATPSSSPGTPSAEPAPLAGDAPGVPQTIDTELVALAEPAVDPERATSRFWSMIAKLASQVEHRENDEAWLEEVTTRCRNALLRYGMSARLESKILTPNAALLKFKGSDELTVAAVERKLTELETTHALAVLSVRAEPGLVAISIMRPHREVLTLAEVWKDWQVPSGQANNRLLIAVKEEDGAPLFLEPEPDIVTRQQA